MISTGELRMRPEKRSQRLLSVTNSKAKMYEYGVPDEHHIDVPRDPARLFSLSVGLLGDLAARITAGDVDEERLREAQEALHFSAHFFDAYLEAKLNETLSPYLLLLGSASYYLCDLPGSSRVLASRLDEDCADLGCSGLEDLLLWLLQADLGTYVDGADGAYGDYIDAISQGVVRYFDEGQGEIDLGRQTIALRRTAYASGTARELLLADIIGAMVKKRLANSAWHCLPQYSNLAVDQWQQVLQKESFVRELWPAQRLLGEHGVFRGRSAVVQMPTSAGKTKATEIIIRSAFLSGRASLAVIVAPFRALCHEIRNALLGAFRNEAIDVDELSDVLQPDFQIDAVSTRQQALVVTPEKLVYMLRQVPDLAEKIGLLIYDEGHQFDSGTRGITYELLVSSLRMTVPEGIQTVLASAVMSNAAAVGHWLNGEESEIVVGRDLAPTRRTIAFASWQDQLGRLEFVTPQSPDKREFYVPRVIEQFQLQLKVRERKEHVFPERDDGRSVALYLGLKLAVNGSVALFCGTKRAASGLCEKAVDAFERGLPLRQPVEWSDPDEVRRLHFLHERNLGGDAASTRSAELGIFAHHGNTPHGIRLAVEHAMKEGLAKFVVCTSTLAQGVNLPIRYLIVTSVRQGRQQIKVRDFHNLIGRAGRSGMHTEGSILFSDPKVYDQRRTWYGRQRWGRIKALLEPSNAEPCASTLLSLFEPLHSDDDKYEIGMEPLSFVQAYVESTDAVDKFWGGIASEHEDEGFSDSGLREQAALKLGIISAVESYLMAHWDDSDGGLLEDDITGLATGTLAYSLADESQRSQIVGLFKLLARNVEENVPETPRRKAYGRTLYGVWTSAAIESWVAEHTGELILCGNHDELLTALWPILSDNIGNRAFGQCDPPDVLRDIALGWIHGQPFHELASIPGSVDARLVTKKRRRELKLQDVVNICENALAYEGTLALGAVTEMVGLVDLEEGAPLVGALKELQKSLKYGVPFSSAITLYELGFADRVIALELSSLIGSRGADRTSVVKKMTRKEQQVRELLGQYPAYFAKRLDDVLQASR
jgi:RAD3-like DEAD/DEAH box helicase/helicase-like protein